MRRFVCVVLLAVSASACHTERMIYANDFSFANYQYLVIDKPQGQGSPFLYSLDLDVGNVLSKYGLRVLGDKEAADLTDEQKRKTLIVRGAMDAQKDERMALSVSFDDYVTDRSLANMTATSKGNVYDADDRSKAYQRLQEALRQSIEQEKGLREVQPKN